MRRRALAAVAFGASLLFCLGPARAQDLPAGPVVFAAASLTDAMTARGEAWRAKGRALPRLTGIEAAETYRRFGLRAP